MKKILLALSLVSIITLPSLAGSPGTVYYIRAASFTQAIVSPSYVRLLQRSLEQAYADPTLAAVILEINTPGGRLDAALDIKDLLLRHGAHTQRPLIAFVNSHAISAGALIALSCPHLVMAESATIGDAAPVSVQNGQTVRLGEKALAAVRGVFKGLAERFNRPARVLMAMADSDIILTGARDGIEKPHGKLLTLSAQECRALRIAAHVVSDLNMLLRRYNLEKATLKSLDYTNTDRALIFLTSPLLSGILLTLGLVGLFFEVKTPGWGVGGTVGLLCLGAFFTTQLMLNPASWAAPVLFIIGVILLLVEVFIIPGFGLVGIGGILLMLGSIFWALGVDNIRRSATILAGSLIATGFLTALVFKLAPKTKTFRKIVLLNSEKEYIRPTDHDHLCIEPGAHALALTNLRPSGTIQIGEAKVDAMSDGAFIRAGEQVVVVGVDGMKVLVRASRTDL